MWTTEHQPSGRPLAAPGAAPADDRFAPTAVLRPVSPRVGATVDRAVVRVTENAAVKINAFPTRPGYPSGRAHWETHLHVETWVRDVASPRTVWLDLHLFAHDGALVHSETLPLVYERPAGDGGDVFVLNRRVYEGATATPGSVTPRPDVRLAQYRLYCELDGRVVTDGQLHECHLRPDAASA